MEKQSVKKEPSKKFKKEKFQPKEKPVGAPATQKRWVLIDVPARLKKPTIISKKEGLPLVKPQQMRCGKDGKSKVQWFIMHYEEVVAEKEPFNKGQLLARMDVVHCSSGVMLQNVMQIKYEVGHVFILPTFRQQLIKEGRPRDLAYLRFQKQKHSDMFQYAMEDVVKELLSLNQERFSLSRCQPQIPDKTKQRCLLLIAEVRERARLKALDLPQPPRKELDLCIEL